MMIDRNDVLGVVNECMNMQSDVALDYDTPIMVDSFALVWLRHLLEERHGLVVEPGRDDVLDFTSARAIHEYLARTHPEQVAAAAESGQR